MANGLVSFVDGSPAVIAIGVAPVGFIAIGGTPVGAIAIGINPIGILSFGVLAIGAVAVGLMGAFGGYACALGAAFGIRGRAWLSGTYVHDDYHDLPFAMEAADDHVVPLDAIASGEVSDGWAYVNLDHALVGDPVIWCAGSQAVLSDSVMRELRRSERQSRALAHLRWRAFPLAAETAYRALPVIVTEVHCDAIRLGGPALRRSQRRRLTRGFVIELLIFASISLWACWRALEIIG